MKKSKNMAQQTVSNPALYDGFVEASKKHNTA
jgi:hypothetical protein